MLSRLAISAREPNQPWIPSSDPLDQQDDVLHVHTMPSFGDRWGAKIVEITNLVVWSLNNYSVLESTSNQYQDNMPIDELNLL